jgi:acyl-CoA thioesterase-1
MKTVRQKIQTWRFAAVFFFLFYSLLLPGCEQQQERVLIAEQGAETPVSEGVIIAVGDSLTAGLGVAEQEAYPALLERKLKKNGYNFQVINAGISGETSSGALSRIGWIIAQQPDIVILETGANDGLRGIPTQVIYENISRTVQLLKEGGVTVVLAGMQMLQNLGPVYTREFSDLYPQVAREQDIILIPFFLQEVAGNPALNQTDAIHPTVAGHRIIAETVYPYVLQVVQAGR